MTNSINNKDIPLVLDVDGTLLKNDLTHELILKGVLKRFWKLPTLIKHALASKPALKLWLVEQVGTDIHPETLPYHDEIIALAKEAKTQGREVVLCSGSQEQLVDRLVKHLDWVDAGFGTTPTYNMTCENKAKFLKDRYPDGFDYAGNSTQDFAVWKAARKGYAIEPPKAAHKTKSQNGEAVEILKKRQSQLWALLKTARPVYLLAVIISLVLFPPNSTLWNLHTIFAFFILGAACFSISFARDIAFIEKDRQRKLSHSGTPLSNGNLSLPKAMIAFIFCLPGLYLSILALL